MASAPGEPTDKALRDACAAIEYCYQQGWTDGLPVVPPIPELVDQFLSQTSSRMLKNQ